MKFKELEKWLNSPLPDFAKNVNNNLPKITVITPSYNQGDFIEDTIKSVLLQNYPNLEFFVFDGGSTDKTVEILKKYEKSIDFWISEKDKGQSDAINKGFKKATGDIICWLNSDDLFTPDTLIYIANKYIKTQFDFVYGRNVYLFSKINMLLLNPTTNLANNFAIKDCDFLVQPSTFWSKKLLEKNGLLSENLHYSFDWEWFIRAQNNGFQLEKSDRILSVYRIHEEHKSSSAGQKRIHEIAEIYKKNHNKQVADAYLRLNATPWKITIRRILKRLPNIMSWILWKLKFSRISFHQFRSILQM